MFSESMSPDFMSRADAVFDTISQHIPTDGQNPEITSIRNPILNRSVWHCKVSLGTWGTKFFKHEKQQDNLHYPVPTTHTHAALTDHQNHATGVLLEDQFGKRGATKLTFPVPQPVTKESGVQKK